MHTDPHIYSHLIYNSGDTEIKFLISKVRKKSKFGDIFVVKAVRNRHSCTLVIGIKNSKT